MARALVKEIKDTRKNYIINGDMRISQRATLFTSIASDRYCLDRFLYRKSGAMVHSIAQDTDVPSMAQANYLFQNSLLSTVTTIDNSLAATDFCTVQHRIEGYNWANLAQKISTVSFWVKSSQTGTYCVALVNSGGDRSCVQEYVINAANTWEYKTVTFPASPSAGSWNYTSGIGVSVCWTLAAGSNFQTAAGTWQTGNFLSTTNQVNATNTITTSWRMTGVKINEGSVASPFSLFAEDVGAELLACMRYFEKSYAQGSPVPTITSNGAVQFGAGTSTHRDSWVIYKVEKRSESVTRTVYSPSTGTGGGDAGGTPTVQNRSTSGDVSVALGDGGANRFNLSFAATAGQHYHYHYTAETEL